jgi:opacity protein-like surface antigen
MMNFYIRILQSSLLFFTLMLYFNVTKAGENVFGFIYTLDTAPLGKYEIAQHTYWNHKQKGDYDNYFIRNELEYGLTADVQIAGYINLDYTNAKQNDRFGETAGSKIPENIDVTKRYKKFRYDSLSFETLWRITNPYTDFIGVGLYLEPMLGYDSKSLEYRLLLQKNLIDDKLILASNFVFETERDEIANNTDPEKASHFDWLAGATYRVAPNWNLGLEYRYHNDFSGYFYQTSTQHAHFLGPSLHYATTNWWATVAWRHQLSGTCHNVGEFECADGRVLDDHGRDEFAFRFGIPL